MNAWRKLQIAFPAFEETRSKLMLTTRVLEVAEAVEIGNHKRRIHKMRCLPQHEAFELFRTRVLLGDAPDFEGNEIVFETGKKMVQYCQGLPLAIVSFIQHMAVTKNTLEDWKIVHQSLESFARNRHQIGGMEAALHVLALSYDNLPHFLRPCFLYLGHFQEHCQIEVEKLYLLLVADGFVTLEDHGREEPLMNVAERYLNDLAGRSMVEVYEEEVPTVKRFKYCQLNPLMRHLSLLKNKEEGFFNFVGFEGGVQPASDLFSSLTENVSHRIAINFDKYEGGYDIFLAHDAKKGIRCLLFSTKGNEQRFIWSRKLSNLVEFKSLRVLDFCGFDFQVTKLPKGIGRLVHLRYLSFGDCMLPELPSSIGELRFLYILDLRVKLSCIMVIPNVLWKMKKLRHLYLPPSFSTRDARKLRIDSLTDLETLTNFNTKMFYIEDLLLLVKLRYLASNTAGSLEEIQHMIARMNNNSENLLLRTSLEIRDFDCYTEERHSVFRQLLKCQSLIALCIEGHICRIPLHDKFSHNLIKIDFIGSELVEDPMKTLEKLPNLRVLVLNDDAFVGKEMICSASGFIELKRLEILNLQYLENWIVEERAMPKLSALAIGNCGRLEMLPEGLRFVHALQELNISRMPKEFQDRLRVVDLNMGEDMYKVKHVPSIVFED